MVCSVCLTPVSIATCLHTLWCFTVPAYLPADWTDVVFLKLMLCDRYHDNRGFTCDIISSRFCKTSYLRPPCWFPLSSSRSMVLESSKMFCYFLFSSYHNTKLQLSDKNISTNTWFQYQILSWNQKFKHFLLFFSIPLYKKETKRRGKLCAYRLRTASCRPIMVDNCVLDK